MKNLLLNLVIVMCLITAFTTQLFAQEKVSVFTEIQEFTEKIEDLYPEIGESFTRLNDSIVNKEGALSVKEKQLISLGIAVYAQCEICIYYHTAGAKKNGATNEEILEASSVAFYMGGGPAFSYINYVFDALEELSEMKEKEDTEKK